MKPHEATPADWLSACESRCVSFESRLQAGETPRIDDFLTDVDEPWRSTLFEELFGLEVAYRLRKGDLKDVEAYVARFPEHREVIHRVYLEERGRSEPRRLATSPRPGRYQIEATLGKGGHGVVSKAYDHELRRSVAVKELRDCLTDDSRYRARFRREANIVAGLQHPRIVQVLDYGVAERPFIVFAFVEGPNLHEACKASLPTPRRAAEWCRDAAEGLRFAHACGVLHRDVKPSNLLLGTDGRVLVSDFGLAKRLDGQLLSGDLPTREGVMIGTPQYAAPEKERGGNGVAGDVYGLGATLFHLLTGAPPALRDAPPQEERGPDHAPSPRAVNAAAPIELDAICRRALAWDPAQRYPTIGAMLADLDAWLAGRRVAPVGRSFRPAVAARRLAPYAAVALLLVLSLWSAWTVVAQRPAAPERPGVDGVDGVAGRGGIGADDDRGPPLGPSAGAYGRNARGLRTALGADELRVLIRVEPAAKRVVFLPWSLDRDEPDLERAAPARSLGDGVHEAFVAPGFYLVEAVREDGLGFHQVFRTAPTSEDVPDVAYPHLDWRRDDAGIELPRIVVRERADVLRDRDLLFVESGESQPSGAPEPRQVKAFWLGKHEVGRSEYERGANDEPVRPRGEDPPIDKLRWDDAVAFAEAAGCRLPSEAEFVLLEKRFLTHRTHYGPPAGDDSPLVAVGYCEDEADLERTGGFLHLHDNGSEWSRSTLMSIDPDAFTAIPTVQKTFLRDSFTYRGGLGANTRQIDLSDEFRRIGCRFHMARATPAVGLGMRVALDHEPWTSE